LTISFTLSTSKIAVYVEVVNISLYIILLPFMKSKEGSANKVGVGILQHNPDGTTKILANIRKTYITPPGHGFQPRDTAVHHRQNIVGLVKKAMEIANVTHKDIDCICFTKGKVALQWQESPVCTKCNDPCLLSPSFV
jgi:hypothetical protein